MKTPTKPRQSVESYKHRYAKELLAQWLREAAETAGYDQRTTVFDLTWKVNRSGPSWGIWEEYPISTPNYSPETGSVYAWDEISEAIPTYQELIEAGRPPIAILDLVIQEKGRIVYGFEVTHQNPVSPEKAIKLCALNFPTYEIKAEWLLRQVGKPPTLAIVATYGMRGGAA